MTRKCEAIHKLDFLDEKEQWTDLSRLSCVDTTIKINGKQTAEE